MASGLLPHGAPAPLAAAAMLLVAALAYARGWRIAPWLAAAGAAILTGALAARGLRAGHWPLTSQYEFALAFALTTVLAALAFLRRPSVSPASAAHTDNSNVPPASPAHTDNSNLPPASEANVDDLYLPPASEAQRRGLRSTLCTATGRAASVAVRGGLFLPTTTLIFATALILYARLLIPASKQAIRPLLPALNSPWLPLHAGTAALAYGALAVAGLAGLIWLVHRPEQPSAERVLGRAIAAGYPLLTLSMVLGMIWAQVAWGRTWGWDLKEVWTLVTWLVYTMYWHLRRRRGWQGGRLAWLALLGLGAVLFTFAGVGWLARAVGLESLHLF